RETVVGHGIRQRTHNHFALSFIDHDLVFVVDRHRHSPSILSEMFRRVRPPQPPAASLLQNNSVNSQPMWQKSTGPSTDTTHYGQWLQARRENDRLGAGACHGSRRRLHHSISAVGPEVPA